MTELADIFNEYSQEYIKKYNLSQEQLKVISAITSCRTSKLGGHADICDSCGPTTLEEIVIVLNVRDLLQKNGLRIEKKSYSQSNITTLFSLYQIF